MSKKPFAFDGAYTSDQPKRVGLESFFSDAPVDVRETNLCAEWSAGTAPAEDMKEGMDDYERGVPADEDLKKLIAAMPPK